MMSGPPALQLVAVAGLYVFFIFCMCLEITDFIREGERLRKRRGKG
jgi:hypothetical protein